MASTTETLKGGLKKFGKAALASPPVQGLKEGSDKIVGAAKAAVPDEGDIRVMKDVGKEVIKRVNPFGGGNSLPKDKR